MSRGKGSSLGAKSSATSSGFSDGAHSQRSSAVCAVCLGRHNHPFVDCSVDRIWDNSHKTVAKRTNRQLLLRSNDKPLCLDWQRGRGCSTRSHDERHLCAGCLSVTHGAQYCPRTQAVSPSLPL
ncbi:hypothetical protein DEU56DRAFT_733874 [Suillus clintonianus]|uniref:uncharacterized protein n=1 Tax=Suillus clintonianus TaxID=1904413 RepID=UPI001B863900|nr:uncharacterized protein DEU56DRAFT_733874 [Suillus clintonianus]KAG2142406.1 hypothetical protein DEU56DRAFT_733874 [Suillus clintonianus]